MVRGDLRNISQSICETVRQSIERFGLCKVDG